MTETKSPITDKPLRHPGQSLEEEWRALFEEKLEPYLITAAMFVVLAGMEWWRYFTNFRPSPWIFSGAAVTAAAIGVWRFFKVRLKMRAIRQGLEGERAVGQFLERLREQGYTVFHDLVGPSFNVDHVLIGPGGVFTVETKTWSKPVRGESRIEFDGERLSVGGMEPQRDPVVQAKAQAAWLRRLLAESCGRRFAVHPIILFPGWYIEQREGSKRRIWVLEPKALPSFLGCEPERLSADEVKLAAFHLSRFIRVTERERLKT